MNAARSCPTDEPNPYFPPIHPHPPGSALFTEEAWVVLAARLRLSGRELQILRGVFDDKLEADIASDLGISAHTIHTHSERLYHKLAVHDRVQLVVGVMAEYLRLAMPIRPGVASFSEPGGRWLPS